MSQVWTDARMLQALGLRDAGFSATEIAARMGTSRAAVLGIFKRIADDVACAEAAATNARGQA